MHLPHRQLTSFSPKGFFLSAAVVYITLSAAFGELELHRYHDYHAVKNKLATIQAKYPQLSRVYNLDGESVLGKDLQVIQIGPHANKAERPFLVPMFKYVANMHGNEVIGRELMLALSENLLDEYVAGNPRIVRLLNSSDIHIMPTMNPDGFERSQKGVCR